MVDAYVLVFAGLLLTDRKPLGDRYGRRARSPLGLVVFGVGSVLVRLRRIGRAP